MDTISAQHPGDRRRRRLHSDEFKANAVALAAQPGMSMAAVAMSLGINANLLRRWVRDSEIQPRRHEPSNAPKTLPEAAPSSVVSGFVPVQLPAPAEPPAPPSDIRMEVRRGAVHVVVTWPATLASQCGGWLRDLLR
ncbi:transposase [Diaphorobacter nitroreducens]|uniref:transposase n=1 Tax=Comamonadaceae TaxID=80864 RepID=UPI0035E3E351